jgi:radical SAM protein with 4Fe4S-binding SPASM domain
MEETVRIPKQLIIELTNRCNLKCRYCPSVENYGKFPIGDMDIDNFRLLIDRATAEFPDTVIIPWMNGEPLMHPRYLEVVRYLNDMKRRYYVTTNATIWREDVFRELFKPGSGCYQLIVSLDGMYGTGSIAKARPGTDEAVVRSNLDRIMRLHAEMDCAGDLAVKICERGQDHQEIEDYIQWWLQEDEIDFVCVGKALKDENPVSMRLHPCQYFDRNFMVVRWNGTLVPCAYNDHIVNEGYLRYGNVFEYDSLTAAYNNEEITTLRKAQAAGKFPYPCRNCSFAYTGFGFEGTGSFRSDSEQKIYFHEDYYNKFYSKVQKWKSREYYLRDVLPKEE